MARSTDNAAEDELGGLYSVPPERFVAERTALARRLRDEGRREEAEQVAKLRRPTRAASAINRAVHGAPGKASGLVAAARELRHVHDRVMRGGGDAGLLKEATRQERSAISDVEQTALDILRAEGKDPSPDVQRRLRETLEAVTHDEDLLDRFATGRLEHEHRAATLGTPEMVRDASKSETRLVRQRAKLLREAEGEMRRASRLVSGREEKLERAQLAHERATSGLADAKQELSDARTALDAAEREVQRLRRDP